MHIVPARQAHPAAVWATATVKRFRVAHREPGPCRCSAVTPLPPLEPQFRWLTTCARRHPRVALAVEILALLCVEAIDLGGLIYRPFLPAALLVVGLLCYVSWQMDYYIRRIEGHAARANVLTAGLTNLAILLAGRRRAHVRDAWKSDLDRPRDLADGESAVSGARKVIYAAGLVRAAAHYRIDDASVLWWRLADGVLASRSWSRLMLVSPCSMAVAMIVNREGFYGLVINAENLLAIGTISVGLVYGGRRVRKVTPKGIRQKQEHI
jgi:hypothetical protein